MLGMVQELVKHNPNERDQDDADGIEGAARERILRALA